MTMDVLITLFYLLFAFCVVYPPTEFVAAGFTIAQLLDTWLGSENVNFVKYHMRRTTVTALVHSALPLGYVASLALGGARGGWLAPAALLAAMLPLLACYRLLCWWERGARAHPVARALQPYVEPHSDWRVVAAQLNIEFRNVDKVSIQLTATSKFVAMETWLVKVSQYSLDIVKQSDCTLVATASDVHELSPSGEEEVAQYVSVEAIPTRDDVARFTLRLPAAALRELGPRLRRPVRLPDHIALAPSLVDRFVAVFAQHVLQNPVYQLEQEPELCIGCMAARADVKLRRRCAAPPAPLAHAAGPPPCRDCHCRSVSLVVATAAPWCAQSVCIVLSQRAVVLRVHGALVGGARGGPAGALAGGPRHLPRVPRRLLSARRVPGPPLLGAYCV